MVSIWPWKGDDTSPASFEKALSSLSAKITKTNTRLDLQRQRSRRLKTLWTLYSGFAYILYSIILALVLGWNNWGVVEYSAIGGGPVIIYLGRLALMTYYSYRTSSLQTHLEVLQTQRDETIDKLKAATKYNSTQQLLEKYGGVPSPKTAVSQRNASNAKSKPAQQSPTTTGVSRTGIAPPPTANIPGRNGPASLPSTPQRTPLDTSSTLGRPLNSPSAASPAATAQPISPPAITAEFAPNAFSAPPQYSALPDNPRWYDRLMDVLLGEDETLPKNRMALICKHCRLVNGQAPPGIKRPEDLGKWRCAACGGWNGEENEGEKLVAEMAKQATSASGSTKGSARQVRVGPREGDINDSAVAVPNIDAESDITQYSESSENDEDKKESEEEEQKPPPKPKRGRPKGSGKTKG